MKQRTLAGQWAGSFDFFEDNCADEYGTLKASFIQVGPFYSGTIEEQVITAEGPFVPNFSQVIDINIALDGNVSFTAIWASGKMFKHTGTLDAAGNRLTGVWQHTALEQPGGSFVLVRNTDKPPVLEQEKQRNLALH